jgi:hypothetical protein
MFKYKMFCYQFLDQKFCDFDKKVNFDTFSMLYNKVKKPSFKTVTFFLMADSKPTQKIFKL